MNTPRTLPGRHLLSLALFGLTASLLLSGCGRAKPRYFEHDNVGEEVNGKINLDRITFITPRLQVGVDQARLNKENIEKLLKNIKEKQYTSFRVKAYIIFDEYKVTLFESQLFEKGKNEPAAKDIHIIREELEKALKVYESI